MDFPFAFGQKSSLLLIFFFHGIVFSFLLARKGILYKNKASKWLSFFLFLCALYISPYMLGYANWYSNKITREILFFVPFMQVLLIGPVIYFYTKTLLNNQFKIAKKDWIHFIPAILYLLYSLIVFITDKLILDEFYFYADGRDKDLANWYQIVGVISMSFYLIFSLKHYANYKKLVFEKVSFADSILFQWIQNFLIAFLSILILRVLLFILNPEWGEFGSQFWHYIVFSIVVFYISINGYANAVKMSFLGDINSESVAIFSESIIEEKPKQETINQKEIEFWKQKILQLIEKEKIYTNAKLTLSDVSKLLETTPKTISKSINSGFEMNFNDFINKFRIEAVKEKLEKGEHKKSTLLCIAFDCGFNSKATFNRAFKKSTGLSPKDYLQNMSS
ncbi:AraC family transcriptional regulator [Polaribacter sp. MED152]|uniref:helix-turn-helix domain-containing protein n=1 Tax=Polaribacter sp. MED152 TaxID=313598 RepID=UPI000186F466|nr:AraC family transcriptional regulator [Polaribacter sp. MED152]EAQ42861.2 regulatory helix-turn-helix protein, AraC family [Polaribacter sp. MED152]